jgi:hypothetical protein
MQMEGKHSLIPLVGFGLILMALAIGAVHSPLKLAACGLGMFVLAARALFLYRKAGI